jgi:hypothetical protein
MYNGALANAGLTTDPFTGSPYAFGQANPISNIELDGHTQCDAGYCPTQQQTAQVTQREVTAYNSQIAWEQQQIAAAENQAVSGCASGPCMMNVYRNFANPPSPTYVAQQVQQYQINQQVQAANHQAYLAQQPGPGCGGFLAALTCAGHWIGQHWDTITKYAGFAGMAACIIVSAGWCTVIAVGIALATYGGSVAITHQWGGSNLETLGENLALAGLGGAVGRLGVDSLQGFFKESVVSDLGSFREAGQHVLGSPKFDPVMYAFLSGPKLASNAAHAATTPDFVICPDQRDYYCSGAEVPPPTP